MNESYCHCPNNRFHYFGFFRIAGSFFFVYFFLLVCLLSVRCCAICAFECIVRIDTYLDILIGKFFRLE